MAVTANQASMFEVPALANDGESLMAHANRIDEMARSLLAEVDSFRARLLTVETKVVPMVGTKEEKRVHPIKLCLSHFDQCHRTKFTDRRTGEPIPAKIDGAKDSVIMKRLITTYGEDRIKELIDRFFAIDGDEWLSKAGYTVGVFSSRVAGLIATSSGQVQARGVTPRTANNARYADEAADMIQKTYGGVR